MSATVVRNENSQRLIGMKYIIYLPILILALSVVASVGFGVSAHAAMAPQSQLASMQTYGNDVNYDPSFIVTGAPQTTGQALSWPSFRAFMLLISEMAIGVAVFFLVYLAASGLVAHYRKSRVRMHSHSLVHRHRHV